MRNWEPRTIRRLWGFGLIAEALVVLALVFPPDFSREAREPAVLDLTSTVSGPAADARRREFHEFLRDSLGIQVTTSGDSSTTYTRDSLSLTVLGRGDTIQHLVLSPAAERQAARTVKPLAYGLAAAAPTIAAFVLLVLAVTLLPIPLALSAVTLLWWRARRRAAVAETP